MTERNSKIEFYLTPKATKKNKEVFQLAEELKSKVSDILVTLSKLGYSEEKVAEVKYTLLSESAHVDLVEVTLSKKRTRIGYIHYDWKPVFIMHDFCDSNLESFRSKIGKELSTQDILRVEYFPPEEGTDEYEELFEYFLNPSESFDDIELDRHEVPVPQKRKFISLDEMIEEMKTAEWKNFGMPNEYNQEEETIWEH